MTDSLIMTDASEGEPVATEHPRAAKRWEVKQQAKDEAAREVLSLFNEMNASLGGIRDLVTAPPKGDVMFSGAVVIPPSGMWIQHWPTNYSAITVANLSGSLLTTSHQASGGASPNVGAGVQRVASGFSRTWAARGQSLAISGAPGSSFDIAVYSRPRPPASGPCGQTSSATQSGSLVVVPAGTQTSLMTSVNASDLLHVAFVLNVSQVAGGEAVQLTLNGVTPSGYVYPLLVGLAVTATGTTPYRIGPALTPSVNAVANDLVPDLIQAVATISGAGTITYGVDLVSG